MRNKQGFSLTKRQFKAWVRIKLILLRISSEKWKSKSPKITKTDAFISSNTEKLRP